MARAIFKKPLGTSLASAGGDTYHFNCFPRRTNHRRRHGSSRVASSIAACAATFSLNGCCVVEIFIFRYPCRRISPLGGGGGGGGGRRRAGRAVGRFGNARGGPYFRPQGAVRRGPEPGEARVYHRRLPDGRRRALGPPLRRGGKEKTRGADDESRIPADRGPRVVPRRERAAPVRRRRRQLLLTAVPRDDDQVGGVGPSAVGDGGRPLGPGVSGATRQRVVDADDSEDDVVESPKHRAGRRLSRRGARGLSVPRRGDEQVGHRRDARGSRGGAGPIHRAAPPLRAQPVRRRSDTGAVAPHRGCRRSQKDVTPL
mmetsp:Transcript_9984/g.32552  ORF Transcript_9984/g.32552 Transcript_9984/m.32552 type:complete len:314 (+) Transcript_9984:719-1660(+)